MPTPQITALANKSGKSEQEVEKMWDAVKASMIKNGESEASESFYPKLMGILKKNLKIEENEAVVSALYSTFLREKDDKPVKDIKMKADVDDKEKSADDKAQDDEDDDDLSTLDGDYNAVEMLHAVIETIRYTDDPEGEAGSEGDVDFGLEILYEIAEQIPEDTVEIIIDALFQFYDIDDEDIEANLDSDPDDSDDETDEALTEALELVPEAMSAVKKKKMYYLKQKRKRQLGKRAGSLSFKRNYKFDTKSGRYKKRKKAQSVSDMRAKGRRMKRQNKRSSMKVKAKRTKKRMKHVKDPYRGGSKKPNVR